MKGISINISYVAPNVLIDTNAENRTISFGKDSTLNNSGIFKRRQKTKENKRKLMIHFIIEPTKAEFQRINMHDPRLFFEQKSLTSTTNQESQLFLGQSSYTSATT